MEITTDVILKGEDWARAIDELGYLFNYRNRINYNLFIVSTAIGIMYDEIIQKPAKSDQMNPRFVTRNVLLNEEQETNQMDLMFQTAVLNTKTIDLTESERLELAFGDKSDFKKLEFLTGFANYGVTKLLECIGVGELETMDNIRKFLNLTVEGENYEIDDITDDMLFDVIEDMDE